MQNFQPLLFEETFPQAPFYFFKIPVECVLDSLTSHRPLRLFFSFFFQSFSCFSNVIFLINLPSNSLTIFSAISNLVIQFNEIFISDTVLLSCRISFWHFKNMFHFSAEITYLFTLYYLWEPDDLFTFYPSFFFKSLHFSLGFTYQRPYLLISGSSCSLFALTTLSDCESDFSPFSFISNFFLL